jgi:hypothetical protein
MGMPDKAASVIYAAEAVVFLMHAYPVVGIGDKVHSLGSGAAGALNGLAFGSQGKPLQVDCAVASFRVARVPIMSRVGVA